MRRVEVEQIRGLIISVDKVCVWSKKIIERLSVCYIHFDKSYVKRKHIYRLVSYPIETFDNKEKEISEPVVIDITFSQ